MSLCHQVVSFDCDMIFMIFRQRLFPNFVSWTHEPPRCMHVLSLESCWIHNSSVQFPENWSALFCPFLFVSILSGFTSVRPYFWPYMIWSGSRLIFCQSHPGPHISFGRFSFNRENFVKFFHESDRFLFESTFQQSSTRFSCITSRTV